MSLTTAGLNEIIKRIHNTTSASTEIFNYIGVGNGDAAFNESDTDLKGTSTTRKTMDTGFPKLKGSNKNIFEGQVTFNGTEANQEWKEWGLFTEGTAGVMLNRVVKNNSSKVTGQTWVFKIEITLTVE